MARSMVIKVLKLLNLARIRDLEPARVWQRYEYRCPGELVQIEIKKIAESGGWTIGIRRSSSALEARGVRRDLRLFIGFNVADLRGDPAPISAK